MGPGAGAGRTGTVGTRNREKGVGVAGAAFVSFLRRARRWSLGVLLGSTIGGSGRGREEDPEAGGDVCWQCRRRRGGVVGRCSYWAYPRSRSGSMSSLGGGGRAGGVVVVDSWVRAPFDLCELRSWVVSVWPAYHRGSRRLLAPVLRFLRNAGRRGRRERPCRFGSCARDPATTAEGVVARSVVGDGDAISSMASRRLLSQ